METIEENHNNDGDLDKKVVSKAEITKIKNYGQEYPKISVKDIKSAGLHYTDESEDADGRVAEEPMDLTSSHAKIKSELGSTCNIQRKRLPNKHRTDGAQSNASLSVTKLVQSNQLPSANSAKKRGRKKKDVTIEINNAANSSSPYENPELMQIDSRQGEVLMAAKSLFSKRTRTLYHWMYPNAPKAQLKSAVSMSWETLGVQEKEFYISQVLGRFGFPQSSLMVNPQLGGLRGVSMQPALDLSAPAHLNLESHTAVSTFLGDRDRSNEVGTAWQPYSLNVKKGHRKRGRIGRPPGTKNQKTKEIAKAPLPTVGISDDFPDDPELRKEFEQFKWTLHLTDK